MRRWNCESRISFIYFLADGRLLSPSASRFLAHCAGSSARSVRPEAPEIVSRRDAPRSSRALPTTAGKFWLSWSSRRLPHAPPRGGHHARDRRPRRDARRRAPSLLHPPSHLAIRTARCASPPQRDRCDSRQLAVWSLARQARCRASVSSSTARSRWRAAPRRYFSSSSSSAGCGPSPARRRAPPPTRPVRRRPTTHALCRA